jgi:hypothetical protein
MYYLHEIVPVGGFVNVDDINLKPPSVMRFWEVFKKGAGDFGRAQQH